METKSSGIDAQTPGSIKKKSQKFCYPTNLLDIFTSKTPTKFFLKLKVQSEVKVMSRLRRTSRVLDKSSSRLQGMKSIAETLDLGSGLSVVGFESSVTETRTKLEAYLQYLSLLDEKLIELREAEKGLAILSERILAGVAARFGKNSVEYAQAGGVRTSDRKRPTRKTTTKNISSPTL